jgi:BirA family biotin operon repressor/biotin-[acetyl-CoA-carboxylase] ligase
MNTLIVGHKIIRLDKVDSTNTFLSENLNNSDFFEGIIVVANQQLKGRGQGQNIWLSKDGENLLFSILLKPKCDLNYQYHLNQLIANSICQTLKLYGLDSQIKWPNDILVKNKKIAGILIENKIKGKILDSSIVGIGLNIEQSEFPKELVNPTSMLLELQKNIDKDDVLNSFIIQLEKNYFQFKRKEFDLINKEYQSNLFGKNKKISFLIKNKRVEGVLKLVNNQGQLVVEINDALQNYSNSEIKIIME